MGEADRVVLRFTLFAEQVGCFLSGQAYFFSIIMSAVYSAVILNTQLLS